MSSKIQNLSATTTLADTDILYAVTAPGSSPVDNKITVANLRAVGNTFQQPTSGAVNGSNKVYVWAVAPNVIHVDGASIQKTSSDGTSNWTGTTTTTFVNITPNFDIHSPC